MTARHRTLVRRLPHIAALFVIVGCMCVSSSQTLAQGGLLGGVTQGSPVVTIDSPASGSTVVGTIMVRARVSSAGALVAGVQFQLDGANLGAEDTTAPYEIPWDTTTTGNGLHTLTAVARDALGLRYTSDPVRVTVSNQISTSTGTRFEETSLATSYTVGWIHHVDGRPFSGGTLAYSRKTESRATFAFNGTSVKWIGWRGPLAGIALVFLDGSLVAQIDTYAPTEEIKAVIYSADGLQYGGHQLWIEVTGTKNPASSDAIVAIDAFDVAPASPLPTFTSGKRFEETSASVGYTPGWSQGNTTAAWSGGRAATSSAPGAHATLAFTGTSVDWIGLRGPSAGIARVFVDGTYRADVDLYEPTRLQAVVFSVSGLDNTNHTMMIETTGLHNPASTDSLVVVDAFDTRARFEETHANIGYVNYWEVTVSRAWSERTAVYTWVAGAHATFTFTGASVRWIGYRGPLGGIGRVYLDGTLVAQIDTYAANDDVQAIVYETKGLSGGSHVLTIEVTGEMNPLSQKPFIAVDAFDINF